MSETRSISAAARNAGSYRTAASAAGLTLLSIAGPIVGLVVEAVLGWRFGVSGTMDAYRIGALLFLLGQQMFLGIVIPQAVVPVFADHIRQADDAGAWRTMCSSANLLLVLGWLGGLLLACYPGPVVAMLAPGLQGSARSDAELFVRWSGVSLAPLGWCGVVAGALQATGIFWVGPAAQIASNGLLAGVAIMLGHRWPAGSLAAGLVVGSLLTWTLFLSQLGRIAKGRFHWHWEFRPSLGFMQVCRLAVPMAAASAAGIALAVVMNRILSQMRPGSLASFGYAWKASQLVTFAPNALGTVLLARLALTWNPADKLEFQRICARSVRMGLYLTLPLLVLSEVFRVPIMRLLFERGAFTQEAAGVTADVFGLCILGSPAAILFLFLQKGFYAAGNARTPTVIDCARAIGTAVIIGLVGTSWSMEGVAGVVTFTQWLAASVLLLLLYLEYQVVPSEGGWPLYFAKVAVAVILGAATASLAQKILGAWVPRPWEPSLAMITIGTGLATFFGSSLALQIQEGKELFGYLVYEGRRTLGRIW